jgi:hypothetical protein
MFCEFDFYEKKNERGLIRRQHLGANQQSKLRLTQGLIQINQKGLNQSPQ